MSIDICKDEVAASVPFGFVAKSRARVVVNKKREVVRVPVLLHRMSIKTQRNWCERNRVAFRRSSGISIAASALTHAA